MALSGAGVAMAAPPPYPPPSNQAQHAPFKCETPSGKTVAPGHCWLAGSSANAVHPGSQVTFTAPPVFQSGETVNMWIFSTGTQLKTVSATSQGDFTTTVTIPSGIQPGRHQIEGIGTSSGQVAAVQITVTGASSNSNGLPFTGADYVFPMTAAGAGLIVAGGLTMWSVRRKHRPRPAQTA